MIAFLPIARYRVEYQVASGRPFSSFERLLLKAVKEGKGNVDILAQMFAVHRRLVVEALVTLMQAGWVSLGSGESIFVLSPSGERACAGETLPPTIALSERSITIVVEKVTGQVARNNEIDFQSRRSLKDLWEAGFQLRKGDVSNIVDPALVSPLLSHQPTEWIRWIGPIAVQSDNAAFAVIDIDIKAGRVIGLPKNWVPLLLSDCLNQARKRERELAELDTAFPEYLSEELLQFVRVDLHGTDSDEVSDSDVKWSHLSYTHKDLLGSPSSHKEALSTLIHGAVNYVAIACPHLDKTTITELMPILKIGLARGLLINCFLGEFPSKSDAEARAAFDALKKLEYDSFHGPSGGRFSLGSRPTECRTSIAFADSIDGAAAIVGNYSWMASEESEDLIHISIHLVDAWAVARLCEVLDGFSSADEKLRLEAGVIRLRKAAGDLRRIKQSTQAAERPIDRVEGSIRLDRDHQAIVSSIISQASKSISVYTDDLGALSRCGWLALLIKPSEKLGPLLRIVYGSPIDASAANVPELEILLKMGSLIERRSSLGGTLIVVDDEQVVLTGSRPDVESARHSYSARIGVAVRGQAFAVNLLEFVDSSHSIRSAQLPRETSSS